jgi:ABC-type sugar transport system ATPase subunit
MHARADADADAAAGVGLRVEDVSFARGSRAVLDRISFSANRGRLVAVLGPSGAGKSTLLSLLAGFEQPVSGRIGFDGVDWAPLKPVERDVGVSFDDAALHEHLTARENLDLAARPLGESAAARHARIDELARALGIEPLMARRPASLSAGERRRVSLGRAFVRRPKLALLDEPFANLDRANRFAVRALIRELQRTSGATTLVVTHDPTDALSIADDLLVLIDGRVRAFGPALAVAARPVDLEVAGLVDDLGMESVALVDGCAPAGCVLSSELAASITRRLAAHGARDGRLGVSAWRLSPTPVTEAVAGISIDAALEAREPAGEFTDLIVRLESGDSLRARVRATDAQELPTRARVRLAARIEDIHLFRSDPQGKRLD